MLPYQKLPKVSIVIPTYNTDRYLIEALTSVENQTYQNIEIIVVNDGSTDETEQLLDRHGGNAIRFFQKNAGQSAAMNFGWERSTGEILGYLSADDRLHPDAVATVVETLLKTPGAVLAYPDFCIIDENSQTTRTNILPEYTEKELVGNFCCLPGPGALFLRTAWSLTGPWSTQLKNMPDMDFFLRLCQYGQFVRVPYPVADFRIHSCSTTYRPSTAERSDEPMQILKNFYQSSTLPSHMLQWKKRSMANALMLSGYMHGFSGRYAISAHRMIQAGLTFPSVIFSRKILSYLVRIVRQSKSTQH